MPTELKPTDVTEGSSCSVCGAWQKEAIPKLYPPSPHLRVVDRLHSMAVGSKFGGYLVRVCEACLEDHLLVVLDYIVELERRAVKARKT